MCGIIGLISDSNINQNEFLHKRNLLKHRGPDDDGVYFEDNVALGHTRLSIIDLSSEGHLNKNRSASECRRTGAGRGIDPSTRAANSG